MSEHGPATTEPWLTLPEYGRMPVAARSGLAPINGIKMYYATYGAGSPVLLVHGGLVHADVWARQVTELMRDHLVIVADSRGHGRSTRTQVPLSYELMASDYVALLDFLKIAKVDLVGWSDGGIIGLQIAMAHPERLHRLFAHGANITVDGIAPDAFSNPVSTAWIDLMEADYVRLSATPDQFDTLVGRFSEMAATQPDWSDADVGTITTPVTIALGDHDEVITRAHADHMVEVIPGSKLVILPGTSHFSMVQAPAEYNAALREFLQ